MALVFPFAFAFIRDRAEREPWLWAGCLAMVNPFLVVYQRKLWPEGFLPFFGMLMFMGFWRRSHWAGAAAWGLFGAFIGQIHMSGFFFAAGIFLAAVFWDRERHPTRWLSWFAGSCLGAWPLIPWAMHLLSQPAAGSSGWKWQEAIQLKFWQFWISDPLGFHIGNPIGLLRGNSHWAQLSDFVRYPLAGGQPTWAVGLAHAGILLIAAALLWVGVRHLVQRVRAARGLRSLWGFQTTTGLVIRTTTDLVLAATAFICGPLMTLTGVMIRRYYLCVTYPLEGVWLARVALLSGEDRRVGRAWLIALWIFQLVISAGFVGYVHVNQGAPQGDYGDAYWKVMENRGPAGPQRPLQQHPVQ